MHIEVLGDDFRPYEGRGLGDSRRVRALLRLLGIRDFCSHESGFCVNWWVVHTPPYLDIFPTSPKVNAEKSHFVEKRDDFSTTYFCIRPTKSTHCSYPSIYAKTCEQLLKQYEQD